MRLLAVGLIGVVLLTGARRVAAQSPLTVEPGATKLAVPEFQSFEAEYGSAVGRFTNQVRQFALNQVPKISVVNLIEMPGGVIVDHRVIDRASLRLELMVSPYFAWGQEIVVAQSSAAGTDWTRVPIGGGAPTRSAGPIDHRGYLDDVLFSPTLAALPDLRVGAVYRLPMPSPQADGTVVSQLVDHRVIGKEPIDTPAGLRCECWVIEQAMPNGSINRFWVSAEPPFVYRRHREVGGKRDFVSELLAFRWLAKADR